MLTIVSLVLGIVYAAWPVVICLPLIWRRTAMFQQMFLLWSGEFVCWIAAHFILIKAFLIPEPLNFWLFFCAGLFLFTIRFFVPQL